MPQLGFGTSSIKDPQIIVNAIKCGFRVFDCASYYMNEEVVG
jgi:diketogulonate reductase-like aldo/keto reductase